MEYFQSLLILRRSGFFFSYVWWIYGFWFGSVWLLFGELCFICLQLPDYHEIIDHPMDFATVREKLEKGEYANLEQFEVCIELLFWSMHLYFFYIYFLNLFPFFPPGNMWLAILPSVISVTSKSVELEIDLLDRFLTYKFFGTSVFVSTGVFF